MADNNSFKNWKDRVRNASGENVTTPSWERMLAKLEAIDAAKKAKSKKDKMYFTWFAAAAITSVVLISWLAFSLGTGNGHHQHSKVSAGMAGIYIIPATPTDSSNAADKQEKKKTPPPVVKNTLAKSVIDVDKSDTIEMVERPDTNGFAVAVPHVQTPAVAMPHRNKILRYAVSGFQTFASADSATLTPYLRRFNTKPITKPLNNQAFTGDRNITTPNN